jgi:predicted kinase
MKVESSAQRDTKARLPNLACGYRSYHTIKVLWFDVTSELCSTGLSADEKTPTALLR